LEGLTEFGLALKIYASLSSLTRSSLHVFRSPKNKGKKEKSGTKELRRYLTVAEKDVSSVLALVFLTNINQSSGLIAKS